jgi:hypothetical protein
VIVLRFVREEPIDLEFAPILTNRCALVTCVGLVDRRAASILPVTLAATERSGPWRADLVVE